ncbi:succinate semialdehyde dehydrogenase [Penicillium concentricum]|uniref:Succinate semialdehyde dehydrogenase n=1 Tax=Penicillium concentricum TaxID=293559 RepID=A0A9W9RSQ9_9EURO|nr:succinate semialdehyde dehydrogenase [Penicillium concentricum]KAJ5365733.1 succinate semialdehyde dehydrogenase [Penicillium concentricum]
MPLFEADLLVEEFTRRLLKQVEELKCGPGLDGISPQGPLIHRAAVQKVEEHILHAVSKTKDETSGPLAPTFASESKEEVAMLANDTNFSPAGYFYSKNICRVMRITQKMQVGICGVNTGKVAAAESPFRGTEESDYGLEGSKYSIPEYQPIKTVTIRNIHHSYEMPAPGY